MKNFQVFESPRKIYQKMLKDIDSAKRSIYLETYIFSRDKIGNLFRKALEKKALQGVRVLLLVDALGSRGLRGEILKLFGKKFLGLSSGVDKKYFSGLERLGGQVRFFKEVKYVLRIFGQNHERNHRKLLVIDDHVSYIGSISITSSCLNWRELVLRLKGPISKHFATSFLSHWKIYDRITMGKIKSMIHKGFEIISDIPADTQMLAASKYIKLINNSKKEILIETPYFVPPIRIRKALARAVKRGVKVIILLPYKSDVGFIDIVRNRYLGSLYKKGINIHYYTPKILHSKLLLVDKKFFILGSSNLDYRSFIHHYEINLFGRDKKIIQALYRFYKSGLERSKTFDYREWRNRTSFKKILEILSSLINTYL